jgi:hypothetical protein
MRIGSFVAYVLDASVFEGTGGRAMVDLQVP